MLDKVILYRTCHLHRSYSLQGLETTTITEIIRISLVCIHQDSKLGGVMMAFSPRIVDLKLYAPDAGKCDIQPQH